MKGRTRGPVWFIKQSKKPLKELQKREVRSEIVYEAERHFEGENPARANPIIHKYYMDLALTIGANFQSRLKMLARDLERQRRRKKMMKQQSRRK